MTCWLACLCMGIDAPKFCSDEKRIGSVRVIICLLEERWWETGQCLRPACMAAPPIAGPRARVEVDRHVD
jgi:hypothetical protein